MSHETPVDHRDAERLLRGQGRFTSDLSEGSHAHGAFLRSPHAAARILSIDTAIAASQPGVIAILTGADLDMLDNLSRPIPMKGKGGTQLVLPKRPALAHDLVRHSGEAVALVVAESAALAIDAAEQIAVEYEPLPAVIDARDAAAPDAPLVWQQASGNLALDWQPPLADQAASDAAIAAAFDQAVHIARLSLASQRIAVVALEPRAAIAVYDAADERFTLRCGSQGSFRMQQDLATILKIEPAKIRVLSDDVGGGFGMKTSPYPEYIALLLAARWTGRSIVWTATRTESFLSDNQGRDIQIEGELALDRNGKFLALRTRSLANMGAYLGGAGSWVPTFNFASCLPSVYDIGLVDVGVRCLFTHTLPVGPYRGAGRPEANYLMERLVEEAARLTGIDRLEIRRRNLIRPAQLPYRTALGAHYDSGDFPELLDRAASLADIAGFPQRRSASLAKGKLRGLGIACFSEISGGQPGEQARLTLLQDGGLRLEIGSQATGQNHRRVFSGLLAQRFGLHPSMIDIRYGDSDIGVRGMGSIASRTAMSTGSAIAMAADMMMEKARKLAATLLQAQPEELGYEKCAFEIAGSGRRVTLAEIGSAEPLSETATADIKPTFPSGCHIAEVEIDRDTGLVKLVSYVAVDDCGTVLDHEVVEGQVQGGIAQGVGQVLSESFIYDESGQILTGSLMDYGVPHADDLPLFEMGLVETKAGNNPLGVKGVGEAGTTGALPAVMNAITDALGTIGAICPDMPATPLRVWQAIRAAGQ